MTRKIFTFDIVKGQSLNSKSEAFCLRDPWLVNLSTLLSHILSFKLKIQSINEFWKEKYGILHEGLACVVASNPY